MTELSCATGCSTTTVNGLRKAERAPDVVELAAGGPGKQEFVRSTDQVEVSSMATYLSKLSQLPPIRSELVASVRSQIAAGTYDTPDKLEFALGELVRDLAE
ncbi:MAG: flagellar biosynthesis anti-sigma factor FlgM [bacterium]|nr:flagellar biosynthesis anti-sigma factor FlgM [bacterium]